MYGFCNEKDIETTEKYKIIRRQATLTSRSFNDCNGRQISVMDSLNPLNTQKCGV